jgi:hypothetical protein
MAVTFVRFAITLQCTRSLQARNENRVSTSLSECIVQPQRRLEHGPADRQRFRSCKRRSQGAVWGRPARAAVAMHKLARTSDEQTLPAPK